MTPKLAFYQNRGSEPIELSIGSLPGKPWTCYDAAPGQVIQGPAGYSEKFVGKGFTLITADEAELARLYEEEAKAAQPVEPPKAAEEQKAPERKGRRADRGSTGSG
jgi:hypothetical protein